MIVQDGRRLIVAKNIIPPSQDNSNNQNQINVDPDKWELYLEGSVGINSDIEYMTTPDLTYSKLHNRNETKKTKINLDSIIWNDTDLTLTFVGKVTGISENRTVSPIIKGTVGTYGAAFLVFKVAEDNPELFSRVTFKETTISEGTDYTLTYTIYF